MQRLNEDDLVGHVLQTGWLEEAKLPAIAEVEEEHRIQVPFGRARIHVRHIGEALHPEREPLEMLQEIRETVGEYNFAGQYQQAPAPLEGGMIKMGWFKTYKDAELPYAF